MRRAGRPVENNHTGFISMLRAKIISYRGSTCFCESATAQDEYRLYVWEASGHIAGVINPPAKNKRNYWIDGGIGRHSR